MTRIEPLPGRCVNMFLAGNYILSFENEKLFQYPKVSAKIDTYIIPT
jgi:hypothetical protein